MEIKKLKIKFNEEQVEIPYFLYEGVNAGSTIFVSGGIHGDEVNGISAVSAVANWLDGNNIEATLKGRIVLFPTLNPNAFLENRRASRIDGQDMNRTFGKKEPHSITQQCANDFTKFVTKNCDMGIDFHDAGEGALLLPHARIHKSDEENCISCSRNLARMFGTEYILEREGNSSMMAVYLNERHQIPVITVEIGGAQRLHPDVDEIASKGVQNILIANRMIPGDMILPPKQYVITRRIILQTKYSGVIEFQKQLGDTIEKGEHIATIYRPDENVYESIFAPSSGIIFSIWPTDLIRKGRSMFSVVCFDKTLNSNLIEMENYTVKSFNL